MQDLKRRKNTNFQLMLWSTKYAIATWQTSISDAGLASGIFIIRALSARIVTGHVIDVLGRKKLLLLGTLIYLAALPIYFVCNARVGFRALLRQVDLLFYGLKLYGSLYGYVRAPLSREYFFMAYAITSLFSRPIIGRFLDHHGGDVVMYPTLIILALCMLTVGFATIDVLFALGGILLGLSYSTVTSAGQALAIHGVHEDHIGLATSTFFIFVDFGVGIGPYLLGFLVPAYGFTSVYFAGAIVALVGIPLYYILIGRSGVFSYAQMEQVRHREEAEDSAK